MARWAVEIDLDALAEARGAYHWYRERSEAVGSAFLAELEDAIEQISSAPQRWTLFVDDTRRYLLRRFPYYVVYRWNAERVTVVAVAHGRRRPRFWKSRR